MGNPFNLPLLQRDFGKVFLEMFCPKNIPKHIEKSSPEVGSHRHGHATQVYHILQGNPYGWLSTFPREHHVLGPFQNVPLSFMLNLAYDAYVVIEIYPPPYSLSCPSIRDHETMGVKNLQVFKLKTC